MLPCRAEMARRKTKHDQQARIRHLIALDARNVMKRLASRRDEMVQLFSRLRDREPLLVAVHTWFVTITFSELSILEPPEQNAVASFYELLADLRWYLQYTQDMPGKLQQRLDQHLKELDERYRELTASIGPPDAKGGDVVDAKVVRSA
ncbi:MAG: hypothetical protein QM723_09800 [Myxococcaceae bacterium]